MGEPTTAAGRALLVDAGVVNGNGSIYIPSVRDNVDNLRKAILAIEQEAAARAEGPRDLVRALVDEQAGDEGLWFIAETASEGYLQQELRRLHAAIEREPGDLGVLVAALEHANVVIGELRARRDAERPSVSEANRRIVQKALTEQWVVAINNVEAWDLASIVLAALAATEVAG